MSYFPDYIATLANLEGRSRENIEHDIQVWYNGYRFSKKDEKVYNPVSLHYLFAKNEFQNYWFNSATPSFLLELLKKNNYA